MNEDEIVGKQEQIATTKKRAGAFIIDDLVVTLLFLAIFWSQISQLDNSPEAINAFLTGKFLYIVAIKLLYHTFFVWQNGMTLGKYFMKIRVAYLENGHTPQLKIALLRAILRVLSETLFYIGFIMAFFNPMVQTLHDKLSNCVVVDA